MISTIILLGVTMFFFFLYLSAFEQAKNCLVTQEYDQILDLCEEELADEAHSSKVPETLLLRGTMRLLQGMGDQALEDLSRLSGMEGIDKTVSTRGIYLLNSTHGLHT